MRALAYHITYGTYGTRLRYGPRPTVSRDQNEPGTPILPYDEFLWEREKGNLKFPPVLTRPQMIFVESIIPQLCDRGHWTCLTCAAGPDHVHQVLQSEHDPETIRRLLKRWLSQALTERYQGEPGCPQPGTGAVWWAECGSIKWIDSDSYFENATRYVSDQRATPP